MPVHIGRRFVGFSHKVCVCRIRTPFDVCSFGRNAAHSDERWYDLDRRTREKLAKEWCKQCDYEFVRYTDDGGPRCVPPALGGSCLGGFMGWCLAALPKRGEAVVGRKGPGGPTPPPSDSFGCTARRGFDRLKPLVPAPIPRLLGLEEGLGLLIMGALHPCADLTLPMNHSIATVERRAQGNVRYSLKST